MDDSNEYDGGPATASTPVTKDELAERFDANHDQQPQVLWKVKNALDQLYEGMATLAAHGYSFMVHEVVPGQPAGPAYPMMMYRSRSDGLTENEVADTAEEAERLKAEGFDEKHPDAPGEAPPVAAVATDAGEAEAEGDGGNNG